ncbi:MAG: DNA polymerase IV [archaeon]
MVTDHSVEGRIVALLDLDYFYAQVEQVRNPAIKGRPVVIVMPSIRENSGAVATCNYEARAMKIKSGMPLGLAKKLANENTVFINADKPYYEEVSQKVFDLVDFYCEKVEQVSIDEAYFELTNPLGYEKAKEVCEKIKKSILVDLGLTCSIGIGPNKLVAKMACGVKKPDGLFIVKASDAEQFIAKHKIGDLFGVGPKGEEIFKAHGIHLVGEIKTHEKRELIEWFKDAKGEQFYDFAFAIDNRPVEPNREKQQISKMMTLRQDSSSFEEIKTSIDFLADLVFKEATRLKKSFKTASIVIITDRFETITKSKTKAQKIENFDDLCNMEYDLLREYLHDSFSKVRRVGVKVSNFGEETGLQKKLFEF